MNGAGIAGIRRMSNTDRPGASGLANGDVSVALGQALLFWGPLSLIVLAWEMSVRSGILPSFIISSPSGIISAALALSADGSLFSHATASTSRLLAGLAIGLPLGAFAAVWIYINPKSLGWADSLVAFLGQVPPVAWVPLTIAVAGIGDESKVLLVAVCTFFVVFANVLAGCKQIRGKSIRMLKLYPNPRLYVAYNIYLKGSMPYLLNGLSLSVTIGWIVLIAAELVGSSSGLGWFVWDSRNFGRTADMMVGVFTLGLLGLALNYVIDVYSGFALKWQGNLSRSRGWEWLVRGHQDS
jgi:ABC-type nitrate/sulfonate/bicarbonate transport system permease component